MRAIDLLETEYDFVIIGSGFGGSVSALRLSEKGYKVLVIEKGKWYRPEDFPQTNWQMSRWLWVPALKWTGIMRLSFFRHLNILSGSGVGGLAGVRLHLADTEANLFQNRQLGRFE